MMIVDVAALVTQMKIIGTSIKAMDIIEMMKAMTNVAMNIDGIKAVIAKTVSITIPTMNGVSIPQMRNIVATTKSLADPETMMNLIDIIIDDITSTRRNMTEIVMIVVALDIIIDEITLIVVEN
jgi:hypothetical protein